MLNRFIAILNSCLIEVIECILDLRFNLRVIFTGLRSALQPSFVVVALRNLKLGTLRLLKPRVANKIHFMVFVNLRAYEQVALPPFKELGSMLVFAEVFLGTLPRWEFLSYVTILQVWISIVMDRLVWNIQVILKFIEIYVEWLELLRKNLEKQSFGFMNVYLVV